MPDTRSTSVWTARGAALLAGLLPALAFPATDLWVLGVVGLVPLMLLVVAAPSACDAGLRVWLGGVGFFAVTHHWLVPTIGPAILLLAAVFGALWAPWGLLLHRLLRGEPGPGAVVVAAVVVPSAWVLAEFARSWDRIGGPWVVWGASLWSRPSLAALASLGGVWLLSFVLVAVNVGLAAALARGAAPAARLTGAGLAIGVLAGVVLFGGLRPGPPLEGELVVAGVQPGVIHGPAPRFDAHEELSRSLAGAGADLVVWAESSVGFDLANEPAYAERLRRLAAELDAPVLVNEDARRGVDGIFKSSVLVDADGVAGRYDKMRLVPFGEYVPLRPLLGWLSGLTDAADEDRQRGDGLVVLDVDGATVGPLVCFESAFPDLARVLASRGVDVVVLQTATTTFQRSWAQDQHASLAAIRAIESGRPVVHAAVSGVSAVFDAEGRRLIWLGSHETGTWQATVPLVRGQTPYVRFGDWVPAVSASVLLAVVVSAGWRRLRRAG